MANKKTSLKPITPSMEDYLEAMVNIEKERKVIRVRDVAKKLGVRMPTVTSMLKTLNKAGLIDYEKYEYIQLTEKGKRIGEEISRRHNALKKFLIHILNVDPEVAEQEACKMEHAISTSTMDRFVKFMDFIETYPEISREWSKYFQKG